MHSHSSTPSLALAGPDHECNLVMCGALPHLGITSPLALVGASASEALDYSEVCPSPSDSDSDSDDEYDVNADDYLYDSGAIEFTLPIVDGDEEEEDGDILCVYGRPFPCEYAAVMAPCVTGGEDGYDGGSDFDSDEDEEVLLPGVKEALAAARAAQAELEVLFEVVPGAVEEE